MPLSVQYVIDKLVSKGYNEDDIKYVAKSYASEYTATQIRSFPFQCTSLVCHKFFGTDDADVTIVTELDTFDPNFFGAFVNKKLYEVTEAKGLMILKNMVHNFEYGDNDFNKPGAIESFKEAVKSFNKHKLESLDSKFFIYSSQNKKILYQVIMP